MKIGEKIRKIREMKGLSQEYLATELNISPQAFGKIEREETKLDFNRLSEIAKLLQVDPIDIINFDDSKIFNNTFNNHSPNNNNFIMNQDSSLEKIIPILQEEVIQLRKSNELLMRFLETQSKK
jgi:transcriptional regulator with XRE-family HTH domain